jgi:flagellar basal body-associated protein FliL
MKKLILILSGIAIACIAVVTFLFYSKQNSEETEERRLRTEPARKARLESLAKEKEELAEYEKSLNQPNQQPV